MKIIINGHEVPILKQTVVSLQENSAVKTLSLTGDRSFSFTLPDSPELRQATSLKTHLQSVDGVASINVGKVVIGPKTVLEGQLRLKSKKGSLVEVDIVSPPGAITADYWNRKLTDLDLGSFSFPTETTFDPLYTVKASQRATNNVGKTVSFGSHYLTKTSQLTLFLNNQEFFRYNFQDTSFTIEDYATSALSELNAAMAEYNADPVLNNTRLFANPKEIVVLSLEHLGDFEVRITDYMLDRVYDPFENDPSDAPAFSSVRFNLDRLQHESSVSYLANHVNNLDKLLPYLCFPTIYNPSFYNGNTTYNGSVNSRDDGVLQFNSPRERIAYPLSPAFSFAYIIDLILAQNNYTRSSNNWENLEGISFCTFVDFARQHPSTELPYNVYPTSIDIADYLPDLTVGEFFTEFMKSTGHLPYFNKDTRELEITPFSIITNGEPLTVDKNDIYEAEINWKEVKDLSIGYQKVNESELLNEDYDKYFGQEENPKITVKMMPVAPMPTFQVRREKFTTSGSITESNVTWQSIQDDTVNTPSVFALDKSKSIFYNQENTKPSVRYFWLNALTPSTTGPYHLDKSSDLSFYQKEIKPIASSRDQPLVLEVAGKIVELQKFQFSKPIFYKNSKYLLVKKSPTFQVDQFIYKMLIEIERL